MFAVIKTGGKQYRVSPADLIAIDKLDGEAGDSVAFDRVMVVGGEAGTTLGAPLVAGATVAGEIVEQTRGAKILVFKKRRRKNSKRSRGHRQHFTMVRITEILTDGAKPSAKAAAEKPTKKPAKTAEAAPAAETAPAAPATENGADDLKKLSGVGPVLETKLHEMGITTFAQIAAWTPEDIAKADDALNFKGRIERDDWVAQAKTLNEDKS